MLMVAAMFTNRPIYDSIRTCDVGRSLRGPCPVAKKPILEDRESDQSVAYFVSANFGLSSRSGISAIVHRGGASVFEIGAEVDSTSRVEDGAISRLSARERHQTRAMLQIVRSP